MKGIILQGVYHLFYCYKSSILNYGHMINKNSESEYSNHRSFGVLRIDKQKIITRNLLPFNTMFYHFLKIAGIPNKNGADLFKYSQELE